MDRLNSPNLREQAEMLEQPADMEDPEDLDFLLDDQSPPNHENRGTSDLIEPPLSQIKDMRAEHEQHDETKLDFSDQEAPTESVLLDDYGVEEAEAMAAKQVEEPAFVVDDDKRSVQFSDVAGSDNFVLNPTKVEEPEPKRAIDQASIKVVNKILEKKLPAQEKPKSIIKKVAAEPKEMVPANALTDEARATIDRLNEHLSAKEFEKLGELIFDVEMDDELCEQVDIEWYIE